MRVLSGLVDRFGIAGELLGFFWANKWWWLTPMILALLGISVLVLFANSSLAPFIYTLF